MVCLSLEQTSHFLISDSYLHSHLFSICHFISLIVTYLITVSVTPSLFSFKTQTYLFYKSFPPNHIRLFLYQLDF